MSAIKDILIQLNLRLIEVDTLSKFYGFITAQSRSLTGETSSFILKNNKYLGKNSGKPSIKFNREQEFIEHDNHFYVKKDIDDSISWVIQYPSKDVYDKCKNATSLLVKIYGSKLKALRKSSFSFKPYIVALCIISIISMLSFYQIPDKATAPVVIKKESTPVRSKVPGIIKTCSKNNSEVNEGDIVVSFDTEELNLELLNEQEHLHSLSLELDHLRKISKDDFTKISEVTLKESEITQSKIKIELLNYKLKNHQVIAAKSGIVRYKSKISPLGQKIEQGEEIFFIDSPELELVAHLNSKDISVNNPDSKYIFYSNRYPDENTNLQLLSKSPEPIPSNDNGMSYELLLNAPNNAIAGDTGVLHVFSREVPLGFYLFKKLIIKLNGF